MPFECCQVYTKVRLSLCIIKQHTTSLKGVEVQLHAVFALALVFSFMSRPLYIQYAFYKNLDGTTADVDIMEERNVYYLFGNSNPEYSALQSRTYLLY
jgi:hypothetical protein